MKTKTIVIKCDTKLKIPFQKLEPFQGNLKSLSEESFKKLSKEILTTGFAFPLYVTKTPDKKWKIIGGHQRLRVITDLSRQGYKIPDLPCVEIPFESIPMAKRRILQDVSQYGDVESQGLYEFSIENKIMPDDILESFDIPEIDLEEWNNEFFEDPDPKAGEASDDGEDEELCPQCGQKLR